MCIYLYKYGIFAIAGDIEEYDIPLLVWNWWQRCCANENVTVVKTAFYCELIKHKSVGADYIAKSLGYEVMLFKNKIGFFG